MRVHLAKVRRWTGWPAWAVGAAAAWAALVGLAVWLGGIAGQSPELCLFKRLTRYSCPTCGATRGVLSILRGDVPAAWRLNPLLFTVLAAAGVLLAIRLAFGWAVRVEWTRPARVAAWALALAAIALNWAYVIRSAG